MFGFNLMKNMNDIEHFLHLLLTLKNAAMAHKHLIYFLSIFFQGSLIQSPTNQVILDG